MKLIDYLAKHEITQAAFAEKLEVSQGLVYQWLAGKRPVSAEQCTKIEKITDGEVRCEELNDKVDWAYVRDSHLRDALAEPAKQS